MARTVWSTLSNHHKLPIRLHCRPLQEPCPMRADSGLQPSLDTLITADPEILGGRRVFRGTRIPVEILFENLADGMALAEILEEYPTLDRDDAVRVLELMAANLAA